MTERLISFNCLTCVKFLLNIPAVSYSNMIANVNQNVKLISSTTIDTAVMLFFASTYTTKTILFSWRMREMCKIKLNPTVAL